MRVGRPLAAGPRGVGVRGWVWRTARPRKTVCVTTDVVACSSGICSYVESWGRERGCLARVGWEGKSDCAPLHSAPHSAPLRRCPRHPPRPQPAAIVTAATGPTLTTTSTIATSTRVLALAAPAPARPPPPSPPPLRHPLGSAWLRSAPLGVRSRRPLGVRSACARRPLGVRQRLTYYLLRQLLILTPPKLRVR